MPAYYPIYLDVRERRCLVFGGNHEGERKARYLIDCGGEVTLFGSTVTHELQRLASEGVIEWVRREYEPGDLEGAWLTIVADTSNPGVNEAISKEAREHNVLLNVMDVTHLCTFIAPAIIQRAGVTVAVSTGGGSPALARRLRERISDPEYCQCLRWAEMGPLLADVRREVRARQLNVTPDEWQECLTLEVLELFESGAKGEARDRLMEALEARSLSKSM